MVVRLSKLLVQIPMLCDFQSCWLVLTPVLWRVPPRCLICFFFSTEYIFGNRGTLRYSNGLDLMSRDQNHRYM